MKLNFYITILVSFILFTSCKSVRNITNRDNSGSEVVVKKYGTEKREFINGIQVTLGTVTTTKQKTSSITSASPNKNLELNGRSNTPIISGDIERANLLQLKYSPIINVPVTQLVNIMLLEQIDKWWGTKYCIGGNGETCIDCSGFTHMMMKDVYNVNILRTAQEQYNQSQRIEQEDLREGDLVFFGHSYKSISHVGIYLQNNKFVHASTSVGVTITDLNDKYWNPKFRGGGRISQ